ncbi:RrF2 family transcriptional regulator [Pseudonocardia endophytica]|uniref:BadM/Rrf2 family transcriptional regulator n=1 Tax=Pseudonocardia endophytica TaxID=401976 RepID=A0A4R1HXT5_PSEEN|nr:Rrf2 family transcriptional regulator [Pseudonocardia endophytica]TCK26333.1 BadM/Rrf2 family transcriptional regulator [Pseudonocardia endophytica]
MRISTKADYAIRAALVLVTTEGDPVSCAEIARRQGMPEKYLEGILGQLRRAGLVRSQRGVDGGYWLSRPGRTISLADVIRSVDGPLATVHGLPAQDVGYAGEAAHLPQVWVALRSSIRHVLEGVTLTDVVSGRFPGTVDELSALPGAWESR